MKFGFWCQEGMIQKMVALEISQRMDRLTMRVVTVYADNSPKEMDATWLQQIFNQHEFVADATYIRISDTSCPAFRISDIPDLYLAAAVSDAVWKGNQTCGTKYSIKCTGSAFEVALPSVPCNPCTGESVNVTIVEHCPQQTYCNVAHDILGSVTFILSEAAYIKISSLSVPNITIEYERLY
ncbi:hypothetical protein RHGRI_000103 [Rhododendron griersonianum]|uniref:Expansin-like EG45 domain-containing protein n=1 Tax=Rhododendron griersonianum TaxID=479676 RepID=A0AAV6LGC2_9ERIC|nr:hypothetical protein RHGRI_000103 [Rhododendron griersonianum]